MICNFIFRVLVLRKAPNTAKAQVPSPLDSAGPKYDKNGDMVPYSILGTVQEFYRMNYERGRLQATVKGILCFALFVGACLLSEFIVSLNKLLLIGR